jgi:hypothetical protein
MLEDLDEGGIYTELVVHGLVVATLHVSIMFRAPRKRGLAKAL